MILTGIPLWMVEKSKDRQIHHHVLLALEKGTERGWGALAHADVKFSFLVISLVLREVHVRVLAFELPTEADIDIVHRLCGCAERQQCKHDTEVTLKVEHG